MLFDLTRSSRQMIKKMVFLWFLGKLSSEKKMHMLQMFIPFPSTNQLVVCIKKSAPKQTDNDPIHRNNKISICDRYLCR